MATDKQIEASRANGARSRGPVTPEGKAKSARNSTRHGGLAKAVVLEGESRTLFNQLVDKLNSTLRPRNDLDHLLIGRMAAAHWRQIRLWKLQQEGKRTPGDLEMKIDRQFFRTLNCYKRLHPETDATDFFSGTNPVNQ